jgi:hypothetical protein
MQDKARAVLRALQPCLHIDLCTVDLYARRRDSLDPPVQNPVSQACGRTSPKGRLVEHGSRLWPPGVSS